VITAPLVRLGDYLVIRGGGTPRRDIERYFQGTIPWVTPKDMKARELFGSELKITDEALHNSTATLVPANTVLLVVRSGVLKHTVPVAINRVPVAINQDMKSLECAPELSSDYLARLLKAAQPTILSWVRATTADNYSIDNIRELRIPLPPRRDQDRIAELLDRADDLLQARNDTIVRLTSLSDAVFADLFNNPSHSRQRLTQPLGDLISVSSGEGLTQAQFIHGPFPVYGGNGVNGYHKDFLVPSGTIVIGRVGVYCGAIHMTTQSAWVTDNALIVTIKHRDLLLPSYLAAALRHANLNQYANRSSQPLISGARLYPVQIAVPPLSEQQQFALTIAEVETSTRAAQQHRSVLTNLFSTLEHSAFRGEL
jgi:type I restriction enzyme S subunit